MRSVSLFVEDDVDPFDPLKTIYDFIHFVDRICVVALQVGLLFLLHLVFFFRLTYDEKFECLHHGTERQRCLLEWFRDAVKTDCC